MVSRNVSDSLLRVSEAHSKTTPFIGTLLITVTTMTDTKDPPEALSRVVVMMPGPKTSIVLRLEVLSYVTLIGENPRGVIFHIRFGVSLVEVTVQL